MNLNSTLRKKVLSAGLCAGLLFSFATPVYAAEANSVSQDSAKTYTLEEIKTLSGINGTKVLREKASKDIAEADKFNAEMNYYDSLYQNFANPGQTWIAWDNAIQAYKDSEDALEGARQQASYDGESRFFSYLQLEDSLQSLEKTIALQENLLQIEQLKVNLGMSTSSAVKQIQLQINELKTNLKQLKMAKDMAASELMRQIGMPTNTAFELVEVTEYPVLKEKYEVADLIDKAVKNSLSLKQLDRAIENLDDKIDEGGLPAPTREQLAAQANSLKLTRKEVEYSIKLLAQNSIDTIAKSQLNLELLEGKLAQAQADYDKVALQVNLGMAPQISLSTSELALLTAQQNFQKAKDDHYLTLRSVSLLEQGVMVGASSSSGDSTSSGGNGTTGH